MEEDRKFEELTTEYLAELYESQPVMATAMGVHSYDDALPDVTPHTVAEDLRRRRAYLHEIDRLSLPKMSPETRLDYRLARAETQMAIAQLEHAPYHEREPAAYVDSILYGVYLLVVREFADPDTRGLAILGRLRNAPRLLRQARENLTRPPAIFTEIGIETARGGCAFFEQTLPAFMASLQSEALRDALEEARLVVLREFADYAEFLRRDLLSRSDGEFAAGRELFDYGLRIAHMLDEDSEALLQIGLEAIDAAKSELAAIAARIDPTRSWEEIVDDLKRQHPPADELVAYYAAEMQRAREFVAVRQLVGIPEDEELEVSETPAFARAVIPYAAYNPPAPFEERQKGVFMVTPPDPARTPEEQEAQLQGHSKFGIVVTALHEAYPGHHLQLTRANRTPSRFRRHFANSTLFVEGWALYCEEMMYEAGFYTDPRVRLMQLKDQLWRACRVVLDVRLHCRGLSPAEAVRFLVEEARLEEPNATAEVRRYTTQPTQPMSYCMGKRLIMGLRAAVQRKQGARFDLRRFHDDMLAFGSMPPRLVREAMLEGDADGASPAQRRA